MFKFILKCYIVELAMNSTETYEVIIQYLCTYCTDDEINMDGYLIMQS